MVIVVDLQLEVLVENKCVNYNAISFNWTAPHTPVRVTDTYKHGVTKCFVTAQNKRHTGSPTT
jgi:hypothetical protein